MGLLQVFQKALVPSFFLPIWQGFVIMPSNNIFTLSWWLKCTEWPTSYHWVVPNPCGRLGFSTSVRACLIGYDLWWIRDLSQWKQSWSHITLPRNNIMQPFGWVLRRSAHVSHLASVSDMLSSWTRSAAIISSWLIGTQMIRHLPWPSTRGRGK